MSVVDLQAKRAARARSNQPPQRMADLELQVWFEKDEVDWTWVTGEWFEPRADETEASTHRRRVAALVDIAWVHASSGGPTTLAYTERPAAWYLVDQRGWHSRIVPHSLVTNSNWRHSWWFVRQWWGVTKWWATTAWRIARGRG